LRLIFFSGPLSEIKTAEDAEDAGFFQVVILSPDLVGAKDLAVGFDLSS